MTFSAQIAPTPPFAFDLILRYLRSSPSSILERVDHASYRRVVVVRERPVLLSVTSVGTTEAPRLRVDVEGEGVTAAEGGAAVALVRRLFDLETDPGPFYEVAAGDPVFAALVAQCRGFRPVLIPDPFEALVWAIIGQQINITFAAKLKRVLVETFGATLDFQGQRFALFPGPERLAAADPTHLAALQFSRQKIAYLQGLARAVLDGDLDFDRIALLPSDAALAQLQRLKGIGRWTAEYLLLRGFGHPDHIPAADGGLRRIIGRWYGLERLATEAEVRALAERWAGWRGYAALHWWFALQQQMAPPPAGAAPAPGRMVPQEDRA
ncbi:MAG: DNA-3-methyladenine glycosylase 2 family protein [Chloroflexi bacterium]|nr:DNA-3-methyladenine glycosylase 2 family protein [Chloroflexota bacterium]